LTQFISLLFCLILFQKHRLRNLLARKDEAIAELNARVSKAETKSNNSVSDLWGVVNKLDKENVSSLNIIRSRDDELMVLRKELARMKGRCDKVEKDNTELHKAKDQEARKAGAFPRIDPTRRCISKIALTVTLHSHLYSFRQTPYRAHQY